MKIKSFLFCSMILVFVAVQVPVLSVVAAGGTQTEASAVNVIRMDPLNSQTIYAGTRDGLLRTNNGGDNWEEIIITRGEHFWIFDIEVYGDLVYIITGSGAYRSKDNGKSWELVGDISKQEIIEIIKNEIPGAKTEIPDRDRLFDALTFFHTDPSTVYVIAADIIFKSIDGGESWVSIRKNVPENVFNIWDIEVDQEDSQILHIKVDTGERQPNGTVYLRDRGLVLESIDGGESWFEVSDFVFQSSTNIQDPNNPDIKYSATLAGVKKYIATPGVEQPRAGGDTPIFLGEVIVSFDWIERTFMTLIVDPLNPDIVYAGADKGNGMWKSIDRGVNWSAVGLEGKTIFSLDAAYNEDGSLDVAIAGTSGGVFASYSNIAPEGWVFLAGPSGYVVIDEDNSDIIYAASSRDGLFKSVDGGQKWVSINQGFNKEVGTLGGMEHRMVKYVEVDPNSPNVVYAIIHENGGIYKSEDAGDSWTKIGPLNAYGRSLEVLNGNPNILYFGEENGDGVLKSEDAGLTWKSIGLTGERIQSLKIDGGKDDYSIYVGTYTNGAYKSTDKGKTWKSLDKNLNERGTSVRYIAIAPFVSDDTSYFLDKIIKPVYAAEISDRLVYLVTSNGLYSYEISGEVATIEGDASIKNNELSDSTNPLFTLSDYLLFTVIISLVFLLISLQVYKKKAMTVTNAYRNDPDREGLGKWRV